MKLAEWIGFLCLIIALVILWQFRQILLLIFTAIILSVALNSLVRRLQRLRMQRGQAVLSALVLVTLVGITILSLVLPPFLNQFEQLINLAPAGFEQLVEWTDKFLADPPNWLPNLELELPTINELARQVGPFAQNLLGNFFAFFSNSLTTLLQLLLVLVLTLMFLANPLSYRRLIVRLFPSFYRRRANEVFSKCVVSLLLWMGGIVINSLFISILCAMSLIALGIPFVYAHALLAGVFNFIPNVGPAASVVFPVSVAVLEAPWKALAVIAAYILIQNLESYWFSPMVMQKQISLLPAATLIAQIFFARFFGFAGLVLALPLAVIMKTWVEEAIMEDILDRWKSSQWEEATQLTPDTEISVKTQLQASQPPPPQSVKYQNLDLPQKIRQDDSEIDRRDA
ncbi:MAG: AI-2E family transporter [Microcoleaceae cyanobacterium]